jgi:hypothetical protein
MVPSNWLISRPVRWRLRWQQTASIIGLPLAEMLQTGQWASSGR